MKQMQAGFTLIELVVVIVILGILAATALPRFIDLSGSAETAALAGVAGGISSASAINYGAQKASPGSGTTTIGLTCTTAAAALMQGGVLPQGYTSTTTAIAAGDNICPITETQGSTTLTTGVAPTTIQSPDILGV